MFEAVNKQQLLLMGGGGHARSCIDVIEAQSHYRIAGLVEADGAQPDAKTPYPVIGFDSQLPELLAQTPHCLITVGQVKYATVRQKIFQHLTSLGANLVIVTSPNAYVSPSATLGKGTIVMHQALVNANAQVGENCIINSQALIEHDCVIGAHCHISTGAKLNGDVKVGNGCLIGSGAVIKQGVTLTDNVIIGANSTVLADIPQAGVYVGLIK